MVQGETSFIITDPDPKTAPFPDFVQEKNIESTFIPEIVMIRH
jgi:hypothetical protein